MGDYSEILSNMMLTVEIQAISILKIFYSEFIKIKLNE